MRPGIAADHGGLELKNRLLSDMRDMGRQVVDFGACEPDPDDDYPHFVVPLAIAVSKDEVEKSVAICGSGVGDCIAANKVPGVRGRSA